MRKYLKSAINVGLKEQHMIKILRIWQGPECWISSI